MSRQTLKDRNGHIIGYLEDRPNEIVAFDRNNHRLGRYDKRANVTYDANNHRVGTGNLLASLLM